MGSQNNPLSDKSYAFALKVIDLYKDIVKTEKEFVLSKQLLKAGTSIGANIAEANGAISKPDFSSKISIAYKESLETKYWLKLLRDSHFIPVNTADKLISDADELSKIMFSILKTTRIDSGK
ncbi:four helix bundle protein [Arenibacter sp. 6A1]|uniref:four helix bundle protein n=1 Tax=Arenibacter sp. 6A1 TaxID=2720391 RepID=UPI001447DAAC|nr:four helix bundle protein [Arenibacter sp. 6A1]NKI25281.1 four helix bundle protein [Arenibacter sp. 6A1]